MSLKKEILSVYRHILRVARSWRASSGRAEDTLVERNYIANECRELFRQNSKVFYVVFCTWVEYSMCVYLKT